MATHSDFQFDLTDWSPGDDSLPLQGEAQHAIGGLKDQVQVLQAEVAVLQRCLHDSIDLQKGILDHLIQQGGYCTCYAPASSFSQLNTLLGSGSIDGFKVSAS